MVKTSTICLYFFALLYGTRAPSGSQKMRARQLWRLPTQILHKSLVRCSPGVLICHPVFLVGRSFMLENLALVVLQFFRSTNCLPAFWCYLQWGDRDGGFHWNGWKQVSKKLFFGQSITCAIIWYSVFHLFVIYFLRTLQASVTTALTFWWESLTNRRLNCLVRTNVKLIGFVSSW